MKMILGNIRTSIFIFLLMAATVMALSVTEGSAANAPTYADVAPIFQEKCVICHSGSDPPKGLRLDTYGKILTGSRRGSVIVPGAPKNSELVCRIKGISQPRMPLTGPPYLTGGEISLIEGWIAGGGVERDRPGNKR